MINKIWERILHNEGETFTQKTGKPFSYDVSGNSIKLTTTNQIVPKSQFEKALEYVPLQKTTVIQHLRAPSYLYGILMDPRIKQKDY